MSVLNRINDFIQVFQVFEGGVVPGPSDASVVDDDMIVTNLNIQLSSRMIAQTLDWRLHIVQEQSQALADP
jgi:hypothetical protein